MTNDKISNQLSLSINQSISSQSINQSINQSVANQSINQLSINQSIDLTDCQSINQSVVNQSINRCNRLSLSSQNIFLDYFFLWFRGTLWKLSVDKNAWSWWVLFIGVRRRLDGMCVRRHMSKFRFASPASRRRPEPIKNAKPPVINQVGVCVCLFSRGERKRRHANEEIAPPPPTAQKQCDRH